MSRLVSIIVVLVIFLAFIVLNMDNKCDISFGFKKFQDIPVFISVLSSFVIGMVFALPFSLSLLRRGKKNARPELAVGAGKKRWGKGKDKAPVDHGEPTLVEEVSKDSGPYGIN